MNTDSIVEIPEEAKLINLIPNKNVMLAVTGENSIPVSFLISLIIFTVLELKPGKPVDVENSIKTKHEGALFSIKVQIPQNGSLASPSLVYNKTKSFQVYHMSR